MLAGGLVDPGKGRDATLSAYVVLSEGRLSRIFKVTGTPSSASIVELPAATTVDMRRFQGELQNDLEPALLALRSRGEPAGIVQPSDASVCGLVKAHLKAVEGLDVD